MSVQSDVPPAVALSDNIPVEDSGEEPYDNYGNYVGEQGRYFLLLTK